MIRYHGVAGMRLDAVTRGLKGRHAMVSYFRPESLAACAEVAQSFALDNGAFSFWKRGVGAIDVPGYLAWVNQWWRHPGFDWCVIPDVIDGDEQANDMMIAGWREAGGPLSPQGAPVWHMHESIERLKRLSHAYDRVAIGSSGEFKDPGAPAWWDRMSEAMDGICDNQGRPPCKLHGLRMMDPTIYSHVPFASVDSSTVARNLGFDQRWDNHMYLRGISKGAKAMILAERMESHACASTWTPRHRQMSLALLG